MAQKVYFVICLFYFLLYRGPVGGIIRKGGLGAPVVVSIFLFIVYYIIWMMGERAAREGVLELGKECGFLP